MDTNQKLTREEVSVFLHHTNTVHINDKLVTPVQVEDFISDLERKLVKLALTVAEKL